MGKPLHTDPLGATRTSRPFFGPFSVPGPFFTPRPATVQKQDDKKTSATADAAKQEPTEDKPHVFYSIFDDLVLQFPKRWQDAYHRSKMFGSIRLFDPAFGQELLSNEIMALWNVVYALKFQASSRYGDKVDFSTGLEMAEQLSGTTGTYVSLASLVLHKDMKKYLAEDLPAYAKDNLATFLITGSLLQGGMVGLNALMGDELDFSSLIGPATSKYTEQPFGFKRPFLLNNIPDKRWKSPFLDAPEAFELTYSGTDEAAEEKKWSLGMGFNLASALGKYPENEKDIPKYKGFEFFPYFSYSHKEPIEGKPAPDEKHKFMGGLYTGAAGYYGLLEGGVRLGDPSQREAYGRAGFMMKNFGPLSLMQLTGELDYRPDDPSPYRGRLNAAAGFDILDNDKWKFQLGGGIGGLLPSGDERGALDFRTNLALTHKYKASGFPLPLSTGIDATFNYGKQDPFNAQSPDMYGVLTRLTFFDIVKLGLEYYKIDQHVEGLPDRDLRGMLTFDFAPVFMRQGE